MHYPDTSFWLETADDLAPRPALEGTVEVDVAIVGGGYTGLWTAWYLRQRDPSLRIAICEAEIAGFGASGRNGGWCSAAIGVSPGEIARRWSPGVARDVVLALRDTVDEVGKVCVDAGIDAQFRKPGVLRLARGPHEQPAVEDAIRTSTALGLAEGLELLDASQVAGRVRVAGARAALFDPNCAMVHPGRLVRQLASRVEDRGVLLFEQSPARSLEPGPKPVVRTAAGSLRAEVVVLATEAWTARLRPRSLLPVYSLIVLTAPLTERQWDAIGWQGHEGLSSQRYTIDYLSRTMDGRILFGGRGAPYHFGSRIDPAFDRHGPTHAMLRRMLVDWFPALAGVEFTHAWGGPLGIPRDWLPAFHYDRRTGIAGAYGYSGRGMAPSNLAGRTLADLITASESPLVHLPMAQHRPRRWEPEPLRWLGVRFVQRSLARIDARAERTGRPPSGRSLAERLARH